MERLGPLLLKGAGVLLLAFILLSVVATVVGVLLSIVATVVAAVVTLAILAAIVLAIFGLVSLLRDSADDADLEAAYDNEQTAQSAGDPEDRLRSQYVDGQLSEAEFERELDRLLEEDGIGLENDVETGRSRRRHRER